MVKKSLKNFVKWIVHFTSLSNRVTFGGRLASFFYRQTNNGIVLKKIKAVLQLSKSSLNFFQTSPASG